MKQAPFTGYCGIWSAVSKRFVFGIQETDSRKARKHLWKMIGGDSLKYRFSVKRIKDCQEHRDMFIQPLKRKKKTPDCNRALRNDLCTNQYTTKREETYMNITIKIDAPELVGAIENLALALSGVGLTLPATPPSVDSMMKDGQSSNAKAEKEAADKAKAEKASAVKKAADIAKKEAEAAKDQKLAETVAKAFAEEQGEEPEAQPISLDVVRGKLADLSAQGKAQQETVKDALSRFGVKKLTDVEPSDYPELLELCGLTV